MTPAAHRVVCGPLRHPRERSKLGRARLSVGRRSLAQGGVPSAAAMAAGESGVRRSSPPPQAPRDPAGPVQCALDVQAARGEWTSLAPLAGNPFATWEWADIWWRHFGAGGTPYVIVHRSPSGRAIGITPVYLSRRRRPLRVLRFIGHGVGDWLGPVCAPRDRERMVRAAPAALATAVGRWDVLLAERLPLEQGTSLVLGGTTLRKEESPVLQLDGATWEELLSRRSANFRQQVRRRERRLRDLYAVTFRLSDDSDRLAADFTTLGALHAARWGRTPTGVFDGESRAFHEDFAAVALRLGWLRLWLLELDGRPVAAWHGFRYGGAEWFYQSGRDPRCDGLGVGFLLMAHALREAAADGVDRFELLRGDEQYKTRFADTARPLHTVALANGPAGRAAVRAVAKALALPPERRRWLGRLAGDPTN